MVTEAHPVEETKRGDSQEDNERPRKITETGAKVPGSDTDRTLSGGNTNKSVIAHSQEEEKATLASLKDNDGTTTVSSVCESNDMVDGPCRVTTIDLDGDLVKSQNFIHSRKTNGVGMTTVPESHSSTMTAKCIADGPVNTGDVTSDPLVTMCERPGRQVVGSGAAISATAGVPCAEARVDAAAGLLGRPGLPGPHPEGGLLQYLIN